MFSLNKQVKAMKAKSSGFTIVELLIVIVVIAILATLVIVTFTGVQQKARNSQRKTDINAVESHLQTYYAENDGKYPTLGNLQDATWVSANLKGLNPEALQDPKGTATTDTILGTADDKHYGYVPVDAGGNACDNVTSGKDCVNFTLTAKQEGEADYTKKSSN